MASMSSTPLRWALFAGLLLILPPVIGRGLSEPPEKKDKAPPPAKAPEVEDPNAKPAKPPPQIDDVPKPEPAPVDGPGQTPPPGVLVVGVRSLPEFMSPQFARSDSERYALDLLFEGLLRPGSDGAGGLIYEPSLARKLPALVPMGREFTLTDAAWGDPEQPNSRTPVVAGDVVSTIEKLKARRGQPGAEVADWIDAVSTTANDRCRITLTRGHIDPLSLMTFKILPANSKDDITFARNPIGSGPFIYKGRQTMGRREYAIFEANPAYRRPNPPHLKAVWMVLSHNPVNDFKSRLVHFALSDHTDELASLKLAAVSLPAPAVGEGQQAGKLEINIENKFRVDTLFGRRIYFLAVNHQSPQLGEGKNGRDMRRFLAFAIQRDAILTSVFRAGFEKHHQPLDGPFPPDSWPCSPLAARLDVPDQARREKDADPVLLELAYPGGDPAIAKSCKMMVEQVENLKAGVTLKLKAVDPADYYQRIVYNTDFQLAYWHYDYPNDWFSPSGLFDQSARGHGGRNFMSYVPKELLQPLSLCTDHRDFGVVRQAMRQLDATFGLEMPFIPLWHLDTHALLAAGLTTVPAASQIDPQAPFTHIEQWSLK
jgi:peptide/nickel transport system substrate-binding protein